MTTTDDAINAYQKHCDETGKPGRVVRRTGGRYVSPPRPPRRDVKHDDEDDRDESERRS